MKENIYGAPTPESQGESGAAQDASEQPTQQQASQPTQSWGQGTSAQQGYGAQGYGAQPGAHSSAWASPRTSAQPGYQSGAQSGYQTYGAQGASGQQRASQGSYGTQAPYGGQQAYGAQQAQQQSGQASYGTSSAGAYGQASSGAYGQSAYGQPAYGASGSQQTYGASGSQQPYGASAGDTQRQPRPQTPPAPGSYAQASTQAAPSHSPKPPKAKKPLGAVKAALLGLLGGLVGAAALVGVLLGTGVIRTGSTTTTTTSTTQSVTIDPADEDTTVANAAAAKALPSVVSVYATLSSGTSTGSGVIYDSDGDIITNYHVIDGATALSVTIDGKSYDATLVGTDSSSDLAVIKAELDGETVTPIDVADSSEVQVGDWCMTVGSPFGLENSVSSGIVSALYRSTLMESTSGNTLYTNLIQTDANINPGNSGGALVDAEGKLIGICTLYSSSTESSAGVGFAIPSNYVVDVADKIIAGETVTHAYIGLSMSTVSAQSAFSNSLSVNYGAYVAEVTEGSPADEAGIEVGDVIIAIGDTEITSADGAILAVRSHSIGETVTVTVMRGSSEMSFEVTLGSDEALQEQQSEDSSSGSSTDSDSDGISLDDLQQLYEQMIQQQQQNNNGYGDGYGRGN